MGWSNSLAYRLTTIEERIGRPLTKRRDELAVALRILAVLSPDSDGADGDAGDRDGAEKGRPDVSAAPARDSG